MAPITEQRPSDIRHSTRPSRPKSLGTPTQPEPSLPRKRSSQPPRKKLRYIPGGPGGGGRYVDEDGTEIPVGGTGPGGYNYIGPRGRIGRENLASGVVPIVYERRDRRERTRTVLPRSQQPPMRFSSSSQAAAVVQNDGFKPREERAWEEFHPNMDIDASLRAFSADDLEGIKSQPVTPGGFPFPLAGENPVNGINGTPGSVDVSEVKSEGIITPAASVNGEFVGVMGIPGTPGGGRRRPGRPPKDPVAFFTEKARKLGMTLMTTGAGMAGSPILGTPKMPKTPIVQNTNSKERLTLPQPSYRKSSTLARFEKKPFATFVDQSMINVGFQTTDTFTRHDNVLIKVDPYLEQDLDVSGSKTGGEIFPAIGTGGVGRVEYDMDEQDDNWLIHYNEERMAAGYDKITREIFEITITKVEKEWHALERRIPKPNPKPPQTQRPRSSSAAAVNGEPQAGEEQDSKCAICDDGDCENTNAIVFCDGCDLAVHQECYGVPFIPEGQWLCRKCQLIGRGVPTCIFCPNTDGAFKQTNSSKWAHLLCAMWIPEVSLGNHTFMEPVMEVEKVPKTRWKLTCYLCNQRMGACIQCGNKNCYQAFHVTCARRAHLFLKMKNNHGTLAILDGGNVLKAFCDKHCPSDYAKDNGVAEATQDARSFYKRTMRGRLWADSQASALALAATHRHAVTEHQPDESQLTGAKLALTMAENKKKGNQPVKPIWKLPSGAPIIPQIVFHSVESSLQRFNILKRKEYAADICRYWTLKREARRGAALLKRLQLQMETFSSMEITRRNFPGMGPVGRPRLQRRIDFAKNLISELEQLKELALEKEKQEAHKLDKIQVDQDIVNQVYFPVVRSLSKVVLKLKSYGGQGMEAFADRLSKFREKVDMRYYTTTLPFLKDLNSLLSDGINTEPVVKQDLFEADIISPSKKPAMGVKERKQLAKRMIKSAHKLLDDAIDLDANYSAKPVNGAREELRRLLEGDFEPPRSSGLMSLVGSGASSKTKVEVQNMTSNGQSSVTESFVLEPDRIKETHDVEMTDADQSSRQFGSDAAAVGDTIHPEPISTGDPETGHSITSAALAEVTGNISPVKNTQVNGMKNSASPETNGFVTAPEVEHDQAGPPTPPVSNGDDLNNEATGNILSDGGIPPFLLTDFNIDGTDISEKDDLKRKAEDSLSDVLSDMDDDLVAGLQPDYSEGLKAAAATATPSGTVRAKKAKSRRKRW